MNEEQAVLEFFGKEENLPLALIVADRVDSIRLRLNNEFWLALRERLDVLIAQHGLAWSSEITEDRNAEGCLVGLHLQPQAAQRQFLRPFMEQQYMGEGYRIYYGLMWNVAADAGQKTLPAVAALQQPLLQAGFKHSESFLVWQWQPWYPRRRDFLLRFAGQREELLQEAMLPWQLLLREYGSALQQANLALNSAPQSVAVSLEQLRRTV